MEINLIFEEFSDKLKKEFVKRNLVYIIGTKQNNVVEETIEYVKSVYPSDTEFEMTEEITDRTQIYQSKKITICVMYGMLPKYERLVKDNVIITSNISPDTTIGSIYNTISFNNNRKNLTNQEQINEIVKTLPENTKPFFIIDNYRFSIFNPGQPLGHKVLYIP